MKKFLDVYNIESNINFKDKKLTIVIGDDAIMEVNRPPKTAFKYEVSENLKKIRKVQKLLIDVAQTLTEMQVDIQQLKGNAKRLKKDAPSVSEDIEKTLEKMFLKLKGESKEVENEDGEKVNMPNHIMYFSDELRKHLETLQELKYKENLES